jgi:hypothetical protein
MSGAAVGLDQAYSQLSLGENASFVFGRCDPVFVL